jgi:cobalamin biosynthesis Co2+ chelatase CbiK
MGRKVEIFSEKSQEVKMVQNTLYKKNLFSIKIEKLNNIMKPTAITESKVQ